MGGEPEAKRRKLPPLRRPASFPTTKSNTPLLPNRQTNNTLGNVGQISIQEAKHEAVKQAQQEGSIKSFKIFDSPFGNFLLPVIPSLADLS